MLLVALLAAACGGSKTATRTHTIEPRRTPAFTEAVVSSNWSGYVARSVRGGRFDGASATWRVPRVSCDGGQGSSAAFWVGIGGWELKAAAPPPLRPAPECSPSWVAPLPPLG